MCLVNHQHRETYPVRVGQRAERVVRGYSHATKSSPCLEIPLTIDSIEPIWPQLTVTTNLVRPVDKYAGWAHHEKVLLVLQAKMTHGCQRLYALPQAHLVTEYGLPLRKRELGTESLIAAQ